MTSDSPRDLRLIVAEDDPRVRAALEGTLAAVPGLQVQASCANAACVCVCARAQRPDVVLVDVRLPDPATGLALLAELTRAGIPTVAISASGGLRSAALAAGAAVFVEKDGVAESLVEALLTVGRGGSSPSTGSPWNQGRMGAFPDGRRPR